MSNKLQQLVVTGHNVCFGFWLYEFVLTQWTLLVYQLGNTSSSSIREINLPRTPYGSHSFRTSWKVEMVGLVGGQNDIGRWQKMGGGDLSRQPQDALLDFSPTDTSLHTLIW